MCAATELLIRSYTAVTAVLVISGIVSTAVVAVIILKRRCRFENFTFYNPLLLGKEERGSDSTYMVAEKRRIPNPEPS